jgi:nucleoside-triphosphatase
MGRGTTPARRVLVLTGPPGSGKTTALRAALAACRGIRVAGFYTEEIRVDGVRRGFRMVTLDGRQGIMAHVDLRGPARVGRYGVDLGVVEGLGAGTLAVREEVDAYVVDEIGTMECLSPAFVAAVRALLASRKPVVATVARRGEGLVAEVKARADAELLEVRRADRDALPGRVGAWLAARAGAA